MEKASNSHLRTGRFVRGRLLRDIRGRAAGVCPDARRGEGPQEMQSCNYDIGEVITGEFYAN